MSKRERQRERQTDNQSQTLINLWKKGKKNQCLQILKL